MVKLLIAVFVSLAIANPLYVWLIADSSHHNMNHYTVHVYLEIGCFIAIWFGYNSLRREV